LYADEAALIASSFHTQPRNPVEISDPNLTTPCTPTNHDGAQPHACFYYGVDTLTWGNMLGLVLGAGTLDPFELATTRTLFKWSR